MAGLVNRILLAYQGYLKGDFDLISTACLGKSIFWKKFDKRNLMYDKHILLALYQYIGFDEFVQTKLVEVNKNH